MRIAVSVLAAALLLLAAGIFVHRAAGVFRAQYRDFFPAREAPGAMRVATGSAMAGVSFALDDGTRIAGWSLPTRNGVVVL